MEQSKISESQIVEGRKDSSQEADKEGWITPRRVAHAYQNGNDASSSSKGMVSRNREGRNEEGNLIPSTGNGLPS